MSKHRFLTHFSATQVASRVFMHRLLSLAFVGASLTALAACGSTAADIAAKASAEAARLEALRLAELGTVALPAESSSTAHQIKTPYVNPGSTSITGSIGYTKATGLTIDGLKDTPEAQGVSGDITTTPSPVTGYDFADLTLSAFYPTPSGADDDDDVPFLLIWQFAGADRKGSKGGTPLNTANGKFIAPGIEKFRYRIPDGQEDQFETAGLSETAGTVPRSHSAYIERMLDGFEPNKEIDDGAELSAETPRPLPYAEVKSRPSVIPGNSHLSRIVLDGSSTFWAGGVNQASYATSGTPRAQDANIPSYDVELIFPKRDSTDWALRYSGFILMRAFHRSGTLAQGATAAENAKQSYINVFTYTSNHATDMTEPLKALFENNPSNEEKTQATATYKSVFAAWGVAVANPNEHHFLYDDTVRLTATFEKDGGGTLKGTLTPLHYKTKDATGGGISINSPFSGGTPWSGADGKQRFIVLEGVTWSGKTGAKVRFKGKAEVQLADGTVVDAYNTYGANGDNEESVDGTFAGPGGQEIVAEIRLKAKATATTEPTILGGISGHNYARDE